MKGGRREGAGRPFGSTKAVSEMRPHRQLRAYDAEWSLIKDFMYIVREIGTEDAQNFIDKLKTKYKIDR